MFYSLATIPDASSTWNQIGSYSSPTFDQFLPWVLFALGLVIGSFLALFLGRTLLSAAQKLYELLRPPEKY